MKPINNQFPNIKEIEAYGALSFEVAVSKYNPSFQQAQSE
jgi:hypothetical protein